ncbi:unnamed protein product, partial [Meganyctiphanes norvegica]
MHKVIPPHSIKEEEYDSDDINDNKQYTIITNENDNMHHDLADDFQISFGFGNDELPIVSSYRHKLVKKASIRIKPMNKPIPITNTNNAGIKKYWRSENSIDFSNEVVCVFCLKRGELVKFCRCNAISHKKCAISYITYPSKIKRKCCMCKRDLPFTVIDDDTPMHCCYGFALTLITLLYLALIAGSMYLTHFIFWNYIPLGDDFNIYLYIYIVSNVGIIPPVIVVLLLSCVIDCCIPYLRWGWGVGGCTGSCPNWRAICKAIWVKRDSCGGELMVMLICVLVLFMAMILVVLSSVYIFYNIYQFHKSFKLKSKSDIKFDYER